MTETSHHTCLRVGPKKSSAAPAPAKHNSVGTRWHSTQADSSTMAGILDRPVRMPRTTTPRNTRAIDSPSEKAYSPAMVE